MNITNEVKPIRENLPIILSAMLGITLGLVLTGAVLFTSFKAAQFFWNM